MPNLIAKTAPELWLQTARSILIREGIQAVKIDRLANELSVTRGGFYHHFKNRSDFLKIMAEDWLKRSHFLPNLPTPITAKEASAFMQALVDRIIDETEYDPRFDGAMRDWARTSTMVEKAVRQKDASRLKRLQQVFTALGYEEDEAMIRARIFYFHQIGYYTLDLREKAEERRTMSMTYLDALGGEKLTRALTLA